ncbi:alpha/beta hydrolase [Streptomyces sioyaensis]|uniref:alpha/beta hydrolase n=1 Tax=Streptomyces sioyaensis TaxID=67364 RepID=UPI0034070200
MKTNVTFPSNGLTLAGHLYTPGTPSAGPAPAVVVGHPAMGVKEQTAAVYAERLAARGFVALTFDAAYQGESEGEPHGLENPFQRADDFRNAVSYLATRDDVAAERIGVLGICSAGGYAPFAAQTDHRMKAVATISAMDLAGFFKSGDPAGFATMVEAAGRQRSEEAAGETPALVSVLPELDQIDASTPELVRESVDYYKTPRGGHPRATGLWVARSADQLDQFDAYAQVDKIAPRPFLMIAGTEAATRPFSAQAVAKAGRTAELFDIEGATHVDLYDKDEYVTQAVAKLSEFFGAHLAA